MHFLWTLVLDLFNSLPSQVLLNSADEVDLLVFWTPLTVHSVLIPTSYRGVIPLMVPVKAVCAITTKLSWNLLFGSLSMCFDAAINSRPFGLTINLDTS